MSQRTNILSVRLSDEELSRVVEVAEETGLARSEVLRATFMAYGASTGSTLNELLELRNRAAILDVELSRISMALVGLGSSIAAAKASADACYGGEIGRSSAPDIVGGRHDMDR